MPRSIAVLMWKHAVVRKRKFIFTIVSLVSPVLFFALLFTFRKEINAMQPGTAAGDGIVQRTEEIRLSDNSPLGMETPISQVTVLYHPKSSLANSLMDEVAEKLSWNRLKTFPARRTVSSQGYYPYTNQTQMLAFVDLMKEGDAVIIFQNLDTDTWPSKLNYTIRMKADFDTKSYEPEDSMPNSHRMFGDQYLTFMRIQWAIDSSYIKVLSGADINQSVTLQEFPYYKTGHNASLPIVCKLLEVLCWLSLLLVFVDLMCRLLGERTSGIQELIKMVGVHNHIIGLCHYLNVLPSGLIFAISGGVLLKISPAIIPNTNGFYLFLMLILYFNTIIALAFVCNYIITNTEYATTLAVVSYGLLWVPIRVLDGYHLPHLVRLLTGFLPHMPMVWFWRELCLVEMNGNGISLGTMFMTNYRNNESVFNCYAFLILQNILYFALAYYLSLVRPGKYGQALPWNFLCKSISRPKKDQDVENKIESESIDLIQRDKQYFETPPAGMEVGISINNVTKVYPKHTALNNVSLDVFMGEITVLVGHNGAGKTTLMSIITGMTGPTSGQVTVRGYDTTTQQHEVRKRIGLCPQHNMFFPDLTLQEHIMFFTMLKRGTYSEARESSLKLAEQLNLGDKLGALCASLSGGMKRRAQLACALAGDAEVLVLDEPTSGLDVESRRELWDLLLSLRGSRTVLLSTHFMEEADVLGDRVAALHSGQLRCFATTMYLKKVVGDGYRLTLTTVGPPNADAITDKVVERIPDATLKEKTINSISYNLPANATSSFPKLFATLEKNRSKLNIDSIGVGVSTLEEVFLKLCSDVEAPPPETNDVETNMTAEARGAVGVKLNGSVSKPQQNFEKYFESLEGVTHTKITGAHLYFRMLMVLFMRQVFFVLHRKWIFLSMQLILPVVLIFTVTSHLNNEVGHIGTRSLTMDLDIYAEMPVKRVLYNIRLKEAETPILRAMKDEHPAVHYQASENDVADTVLDIGKKSLLEYNTYLTGLEVNDTSARVLYTTTVRHAAPVALNMLSNLLGMRYLNWPTSRIFTQNYPIEKVVHEPTMPMPKSLGLGVFWALFITFFIQSATLHCASLPCRERETGSRHIHIMAGCPTELYWIATLLFHMALTFFFLIVPTIIAAVTLEKDSTTNQADFLVVIMVILLAGSMAMFALMYLISFYFNERNTSIILVASLFVFGLFCPLTKAAYEFIDKTRDSFFYVLETSHYVAPPYSMTAGMFYAVKIAGINAVCDLMRHTCPHMYRAPLEDWTDEDTKKCCAGEKPRSYFSSGETPLASIYTLLIQFLVLMILVFMTQRGVFNNFWDWLRNLKYDSSTPSDTEGMVAAERIYVEKEIEMNPKDIKKDSILVNNVHKNYWSWFKKCNAVKGISFSVKKGECFGLLGVNGAGKSTTFKMLTAEECPTRGNIYGNGHHLKRGNTRYLQTLGYCPQFFGLDMFLTGTQNLNLLLTLRGLGKDTLDKEVEGWIQIVGLEKYAARKVEGYSGGCVRRLGAAGALCCGAAATLLDEPSAGVDVAARRRLWAAIQRGLRSHRSIIITSHSMDEMEALCGRIAIMCAGRVRALGSPAALRAAHAQGHAVIFKIKRSGSIDEVDGPGNKMGQLMEKLKDTFNCELKDKHRTMLHYHINDTLRYSELFSALENLREQFPGFIEDYAVTETTLEEVFLSFAKLEKNAAVV